MTLVVSKMAATAAVGEGKPLKERFDYAVSVIRSLPKDGEHSTL